MIRFDWPLGFLLLLIIPLVVFLYFSRGKRAGVRFSSTRTAASLAPSLRQRLMFLPLVLRVLAIILIVLAVARPQSGKERVKDISKGIAIEMVVDRSGSMRVVKDFGSESLSRLDVVKRAFTEFVSGGEGKLPGRPNDLIGMITFARYPDTLCPLTLSHGALLKFIEAVKLVEIESENATSIGDAIALAAARLRTAEESLADAGEEENTYEIKSKVIILLTDGEDTGTGKRSPLDAADLAAEWGIKVYTIGLAGDGWYDVVDDPLWGRQTVAARSRVNTSMLEQIAEKTGGISRMADDLGSLVDVYREIDKLEKSEITSERYLDYKEMFEYFALVGLALLLLEFILSCTLFRRIP